MVSGQSSNPWEKGSRARDGVSLALEKSEIFNVPPNDPAPFILFLGNTSESGEEREYHLSVIQPSNLDGAIIRVGGVVIEDHLSYTIPAGEQLTATLAVERGPIADHIGRTSPAACMAGYAVYVRSQYEHYRSGCF